VVAGHWFTSPFDSASAASRSPSATSRTKGFSQKTCKAALERLLDIEACSFDGVAMDEHASRGLTTASSLS